MQEQTTRAVENSSRRVGQSCEDTRAALCSFNHGKCFFPWHGSEPRPSAPLISVIPMKSLRLLKGLHFTSIEFGFFFFSNARPFLISRCDLLVYWRVSNKADFQICGEPESQICKFILALGFAFNSFRNMGWLRNSVYIGLLHLS